MPNRLLLKTYQRARLLGPGDRHESCDERADRPWGELLQRGARGPDGRLVPTLFVRRAAVLRQASALLDAPQ
ncbi:hypothetical protein PL81_33105 [Streptomyces sp. RSD-27]|nr:hypothetical protein PL81_33105 [Streptomyces sp. RSD-27]